MILLYPQFISQFGVKKKNYISQSRQIVTDKKAKKLEKLVKSGRRKLILLSVAEYIINRKVFFYI